MEESNDKKGEEEKLEDKKKINEIKDESEDTKKMNQKIMIIQEKFLLK